MVLAYQAAVSPGSTIWGSVPLSRTTATSTVGSCAASTRVAPARACAARIRLAKTSRNATASTASTPSAARRNWKRMSGDGKQLSFLGDCTRLGRAVQQSIDDGDQHQRREGGKQQPADDGA